MERESQTKIVTSPEASWPLSFECPGDWDVQQPPVKSGVRFFLRGPLDQARAMVASISVHARPGQGRTLHGLGCEHVSRRGAFRTFRVLARSETTLSGVEAIQLDTAHEMPTPSYGRDRALVTVRERVIFALSDERIYQLSYRATEDAFDASLAVFESLVASFRLQEMPSCFETKALEHSAGTL
jgi:hypothetical protein